MRLSYLALGAILGSLALGSAQAATSDPSPEYLDKNATSAPQLIFGRDVADDGPVLQDAQFFWSGRHYCWYFDGWRGPGYYWCGYAFRRGYGWGGPFGWNGWRWHHGGPAGYGHGGYGGHGGGYGGGHFSGHGGGPAAGGHFAGGGGHPGGGGGHAGGGGGGHHH